MQQRTRASRSWTTYVLGAACVGAVVAAILLVGPSSASTSGAIERTVTVARGVVQSTVSGSGTISPAKQMSVSFQDGGTLTHVYVKAGEHVVEGELLAKIDPTRANAALTQAQDNLTAAENGEATASSSGSSGGSSSGSSSSSSGGTASTAALASGTTASDSDTAATTIPSNTSIATAAVAERPKRTTAPAKTTTSTTPTTTKTTGTTIPQQTRTQVTTTPGTAETPPKTTTQVTTTPQHTSTTTTTTPSTSSPGGTTGSGSGSAGSGGSGGTSATGSSGTRGSCGGTSTGASGGTGTSGGTSSGSTRTTPSAAELTQLEQAVTDARATVDATVLRAPMDGTIASVGATVGETVSGGGSTTSSASAASSSSSSSSSGGAGGAGGGSSSGSASSGSGFISLVNLHAMDLVVPFSESDIGQLRAGQPATVTVSALSDKQLAAHVVAIATLSTTSNSVVSYEVTFRLDQLASGLKAGMTATARVVVKQVSNAVNVTSSAISGGTVTLLKNGKHVSTPVTTGVVGDSTTQLLSGVKAGDQVVVTIAPTTSSSSGGSGSAAGPGAAGKLGGAAGGLGGFGGARALGGGGGFVRRAGGGGP
jgi:multidrug efflux pump subunit AcrA (membrane-fusion protein)